MRGIGTTKNSLHPILGGEPAELCRACPRSCTPAVLCDCCASRCWLPCRHPCFRRRLGGGRPYGASRQLQAARQSRAPGARWAPLLVLSLHALPCSSLQAPLDTANTADPPRCAAATSVMINWLMQRPSAEMAFWVADKSGGWGAGALLCPALLSAVPILQCCAYAPEQVVPRRCTLALQIPGTFRAARAAAAASSLQTWRCRPTPAHRAFSSCWAQVRAWPWFAWQGCVRAAVAQRYAFGNSIAPTVPGCTRMLQCRLCSRPHLMRWWRRRRTRPARRCAPSLILASTDMGRGKRTISDACCWCLNPAAAPDMPDCE